MQAALSSAASSALSGLVPSTHTGICPAGTGPTRGRKAGFHSASVSVRSSCGKRSNFGRPSAASAIAAFMSAPGARPTPRSTRPGYRFESTVKFSATL